MSTLAQAVVDASAKHVTPNTEWCIFTPTLLIYNNVFIRIVGSDRHLVLQEYIPQLARPLYETTGLALYRRALITTSEVFCPKVADFLSHEWYVFKLYLES